MRTRDTSRKVLVLGRDERAFLTVIRSLGRAGLHVHVAWCPPDAPALRSRYVAASHDLPPYAARDESWKTAFLDLCRRERFDLVIPCNDQTALPLQIHRAELEPSVRLYLLEAHAFEVTSDKRLSTELARSLGIPVPAEELLTAPVDTARVLARFPLPVVLKPRASYRLDALDRKATVRVVSEAGALAGELATLRPGAEVLVQEYRPGTGVGVELLASEGKVLAAFQHVRTHEHRAGSSSYRQSVPLDPALADAAAALMRALGYTGVAMVEFRRDDASGAWVFLEINARFWGSLPLAVAAGADFPLWLYQLLVEGRRDFPQRYRTGLYGRNWLRDIEWVVEQRRLPAGRLVRELGAVLTLRERSDTFVLDDPRPALAELGQLGRRVRIALRRRLALLPPLRRLRAARTRRALTRSDRVLFVCKGNICRSPFAEAYAQARLPGITIRSSGYYPKIGRPCPGEAVQAARELGIDLAAHRSRVVDDAEMREASAIFVFDEENYQTLRARFPFARGKVHRLGPTEIRDPYGGSLEDFRRAYRAISRSLDAWSAAAGMRRPPAS